MKQYVVDAFTDSVFHGNQAAVCVLDSWLPEELMMNITRENNFSETAFTVKEGEKYHLRWFTPGGEIDLCGHATLATAFVLLNFYEKNAPRVVFTTLSGDLKEKKKGEKIMNILSKMKRKLVTFFVISFILFLFFWYFISAFCAVYQNTQKIFLRDSMISFSTSLIDPFFIYGFTTLLRCISISKLCKKNCCCGCLFKISDIIPIF